jgi:hypothetical protein
MQDISIGKDALKHLKAHDNFLTDLKLGVAFDQDVLKKEIDDKIVLTQIVRPSLPDK